MALTPLASAAFGQAPVLAPGGAGYGPPGVYAPQQGMMPPAYGGPAYGGPGYAPPGGPMIAPGPMSPQPMTPQNSGGMAIPSGDGYSPRFSATTGAGDGLGWDDGYQSFGGWVPIGINTDGAVMYLDARGFASFQESGGGNFTLGYRYYMPQYKRFVGVYGGYDVDAGNSDGDGFDRFVVGAESVGDFLSYRVNGYIPLDYDGKQAGGATSPFAEFQGNNILLVDQSFTRYQYGGVDGEVGGPMPLIGKYGVSGFLGGYYLASDADDTLGFKMRAEANINDDLQVGGKFTTDEIFDTNVWVTLTLRTPRGGLGNFFRKDWLRSPSAETQMDRGPEREYRIFTDVKTNETRTVAIDPTDGQPILVLHVDPAGDGGTGVVGDPSAQINGRNTPGYDVIYVQRGQLATNGSIQLFDNQRLLSTAVPHMFDTQLGPFLLPGFTGDARPVLTNIEGTPSSVITLANNNEVSGFSIDGTGGGPFGVFHQGIVGTNINNFDVNRNRFENVTAGATIRHVGVAEGPNFSDNIVTGIGFGALHGLSVTTVTGAINNMTVANNTISGFEGVGFLNPFLPETGNGLLFHTLNLTQFNNLVIDGNTVTENQNGLHLHIEADSQLNANVTNNTFADNLDDGVELSEIRTSAAFDPGAVTGTWQNNQIVRNLGHGIHSGANTGTFDPVTFEIFPLNIFGSNISDNGLAGVLITGPGSSHYDGNTVLRNGALLPDPSFGAGFDIEQQGFKQVTISNNVIDGNFGDAIEIENANLPGFFYDVEISGNRIADNLGRGVDILNKGDAQTLARLLDNEILRNGREGVYVVNTASFNQTQNGIGAAGVSEFTSYDDPTHGMAADGSIFNQPVMILDVIGNTIQANGTAGQGLNQGQGLVIRVGTSDGGFGSTFDGGFAGDGLGGIVANVSDNFFGGHLGSDVYIESFVSTVDPPATTGTWNATEFDITGVYRSDPLARLDLTFRGNTFDPLSPGGDFNNLGAFYDNADAFKSRNDDKTAPDPDGPFNTDTRRRNAQRLAFRDGLPPIGGPGAFFQYPGMGESTFRVDTDMPGMFFIDGDPYTTPFDANGVFFPGINFIDQMPYGWSTLP
ncbi:MAG: right-handed parallel beta-helix repeat-containing protein [Planctomycetaceae bacterium]